MRSIITAFVVGSLGAFIVGCAESENDSASSTSGTVGAATPVNENCPIMGGKVTPEGGTVEWNGKTIGFCCDGCDEKWAELSEEEKAEALAEADAEAGHDQDEETEADAAT